MEKRSYGSGSKRHWPRLRNRTCYCEKKAAILISETEANKGRVFYRCYVSRCKFFEWAIFDEDCGKYSGSNEEEICSSKNLENLESLESRQRANEAVDAQLGERIILLKTEVKMLKTVTFVNLIVLMFVAFFVICM